MKFQDTKVLEIKFEEEYGFFYYCGTPVPGGAQIRQSLKTKNFEEAKRAKVKLEEEYRGLNLSGGKVTLGQYFEKVFLVERKKKAKNTYESAYYSWVAMRPFFEKFLVTQLTDDLWNRYLEWNKTRKDEIKKDRLLDYDRRHIVMVAKRLQREGIIRAVPMFHLEKAVELGVETFEDQEDDDSESRRVFSKDEVKRLLDATSHLFYEKSREEYFGLILMLYKMGMRPGEALKLSWNRVDFEKNMIRLRARDTKTRTARDMKINPDVVTWLKAWREKNLGQWVFPTRTGCGNRPLGRINKTWAILCEVAKIPAPNVPYCLRHTFLTECAKKIRTGTLNLAVVAKYAGTSIKMIEDKYLHIEGEDTKDVSELMNQVF